MEYLDLHGLTHPEAARKVREFFDSLIYAGKAATARIVTGNSRQMREVVRDVASEYGLETTALIDSEIIVDIPSGRNWNR